ncbi:MAG: hypothetical protein RQ885_00405 [Desulfurococcales archaeon]|jgi:U3 small nucleolar ribonucleoprotein protein IMP4|nr:hypothetical protein [Desulfurococcales archaeon]
MGGFNILVTSSHRPSRRVRSFINDLAGTIVGVKKINRGKKSLEGLAEIMSIEGLRTLIIVNTWKANPGRIDVYKRVEGSLSRIGYIVVRSIKLSREQGASACSMRSPRIDSSGCKSNNCRVVEEILRELLELGSMEESGDGVIHIEDRDGIVYIWFSKDEKICGPGIGIRSAVKLRKERSQS